MHITYIISKNIVSPFRLNKICKTVKVSATEIYIVISPQALDSRSLKILTKLVNGQETKTLKLNPQNILITPRIGTTSPWSSKAHEILSRCKINNVKQLVKATYYSAETDLDLITGTLHDPMTESHC